MLRSYFNYRLLQQIKLSRSFKPPPMGNFAPKKNYKILNIIKQIFSIYVSPRLVLQAVVYV
jgi:hypothetical protein